MLLHGDLHHENILAAAREPWLAIDPKGIVGELTYEVGALLRNRLDAAPDLRRLQVRRIDQLSEALGLDRQRLLGWSDGPGGAVGLVELRGPRARLGADDRERRGAGGADVAGGG